MFACGSYIVWHGNLLSGHHTQAPDQFTILAPPETRAYQNQYATQAEQDHWRIYALGTFLWCALMVERRHRRPKGWLNGLHPIGRANRAYAPHAMTCPINTHAAVHNGVFRFATEQYRKAINADNRIPHTLLFANRIP